MARKISPAALGRCTVLEIGDSIGNDLGWGLSREIGATPGLTLVQEDKSSTGLANAWFYNWPTHFSTFLARYHPHLVIVVLGANDEQGMVVKGSSVAFASISWQWAYEDQIRRLDTLATNAGSRVLWVGLPVMEPNFYRQGVVVLNSLFAKVARSVPGVTFLPTWSLFADEHGAFQATALVNRVPTVVRSSDGIHFSYVGENVFATFVTDEIATLYHVRLKPLSPAYPTR